MGVQREAGDAGRSQAQLFPTDILPAQATRNPEPLARHSKKYIFLSFCLYPHRSTPFPIYPTPRPRHTSYTQREPKLRHTEQTPSLMPSNHASKQASKPIQPELKIKKRVCVPRRRKRDISINANPQRARAYHNNSTFLACSPRQHVAYPQQHIYLLPSSPSPHPSISYTRGGTLFNTLTTSLGVIVLFASDLT